jgi:hypothetical protein
MSRDKLYYCEVEWFDEYAEKTKKDSFYAFATNLADLGTRIDATFPYIEKIHLKEVNDYICDSTEFFYVTGLSKEVRHLINEANNF